MDKGYIENGFIIDLTNTKKTSEIIYELSRVLEMPEAKGKHICLKLGSVALSQAELTSIKALVELMESTLAFISTSSTDTLESATALDIKISEFTNEVEAPSFDAVEPTPEVSSALDNIFGEETTAENSEDVISTEVVEPSENTDKPEVHEIIQHNDSAIQVSVNQDDSEDVVLKKSEAEKLPTLYLRKTVRSGQSISSDGNIIVIGDVNPGAEIIAKGDITVWGILGGIAHAGSNGNEYARIRALKLNPVQIRIADVFARRPDTINLPYIQKSSEYIPEEAYAYKGSIVIRKFHEDN
ncbi:MAG: septum site-determining protein MinC [Candidatus Gastranaerophilaceae bacterium]